jgi:hypothetical protein
MADLPTTGKKSGLLSGNKKFLVIGGGLAAAYAIYRYEKNKTTAATTASTSTTCTCDDGSVPDSNGMCADGTSCGTAGSQTAPSGSGSQGPGAQGQGMPCVLATGQTGIIDYTGSCVAVTTPPAGKGPVKAKAPTSCPKGQRLIGGKCTTSCPPGYVRLTKTSDCTKSKPKKIVKKPAAKKCPAGYERKTPTSECTKIPPGGVTGGSSAAPQVGNQAVATTNRPASGGSLAHGDTA